MKLRLIYLFISMIFLLGFISSCEKESEGWSTTITYYVSFVFDLAEGTDQLGNHKVVVEKGTVYDVNQNFTATEGETDVKDKTEIVGTVDGNTPGYYVVDYSAVNDDGYSAAETIGVFVSDPDITTDISGSYNADVVRSPSGGPYYGSPASITKVADGIFYVDRMLGSYYYDGVGYKIYGNYYVHGFVKLNADNTLTYLASFCPAWHDMLEGEGIKDSSYDPATGIIKFTSLYASGREFHVTYTPN